MTSVLFASFRASRITALRSARAAHRFYSSEPAAQFENLVVTKPQPGVGLITLNRPKKLNALSSVLFKELNAALYGFDSDKDVGAVVLTGNEKAFAAGADIAEMKDLTYGTAFANDFIRSWSAATTSIGKPLITAVSGYALGGGCELAMMADILYCSADARFGQPEITLGTIPGAGGSQRLTRAIGKSKAMEMILTGKMIDGKTAETWGLAAQCFGSANECLEGAIKTAGKIASFSKVATKAAKEVVNKSEELPLKEGVEYERRMFHALFGSKDQKIGMSAFLAKDKNPSWSNE